jgi:hypothetical protein
VSNPVISLDWRRSGRCGSGACVEVATRDSEVLVLDAKDPIGPVVTFTATAWTGFITDIKAGLFDA